MNGLAGLLVANNNVSNVYVYDNVVYFKTTMHETLVHAYMAGVPKSLYQVIKVG